MSFIEELKRRNVFRVGIAYVLLGWVVMQAADFALDLIDAPNWVIQVFFIAGLIGLPFALFFAWAFELTPEGIKREEDVDRSQSVTPQTGRKLDRAIIAFLATAVVLLLADRFFMADDRPEASPATTQAEAPAVEVSAPEEKTSIAVLPFVNMSSEPEQEFFSDGISEEILNALSKVDEMKVAGRTSSFAFKGRNEDLRTIGQTLGVKHILEGSVRKAGDKVRITAQLIQAEDGFNLWSETYDRELDDIFAIQDDIANRILEALTTTLDVTPNVAGTTPLNVADYNKFLMGRQLMRERREGPLQQAAALLEEVTTSEPDFAPAWAERAITIMLLRDDLNSYGSIPFEEAMTLASEYLERARALDPDNPEMLAGYGLYYDNMSRRELAIQNLRQALEINPNLTNASNWLWRLLWQLGRFQESVALSEQIRERDPLYLPTATNISFDYLVLGLEKELQDHYAQVRKQLLAVDESRVREVETALYMIRADYAGAVKTHRPTDRSEDLWSAMRALNLIALGEPEAAARMAAGTSQEFAGLARAGKLEEARMVAAPLLAEGRGIREYMEALATHGEYEDLVQFFDERWSSLKDFEAQVVVKGLATGLPLGHMVEAFRATDDPARAERFLTRFGEVLEESNRERVNNHWHTFAEAYYATLLGDSDAALEHLAAFADAGHFVTPDFTRDYRSFEFLRGNPEFEALLVQMTERLDQQRAELDLPPYEERLSG